MIGCFPTPYPDEILYSICARYSSRMQYSAQGMANEELFGVTKVSHPTLPHRIGHLVSVLPFQHPCADIDYILNNHTLLPLYKSFLSSIQFEQFRSRMISMDDSGGKTSTKVIDFHAPPPRTLRFCPTCAQEDQHEFGELYWHRIHQVPGVYICPKHEILLEDSTATLIMIKSRNIFDANSSIRMIFPKKIDISNKIHRILLRIAQDVRYLLDQNETSSSIQSTINRYTMELIIHKLSTLGGRVKNLPLVLAIQNYFPPELLILLNSCIGKDPYKSWPVRLRRNSNGTQHPIRHLLFIQFLGCTAEQFLKPPKLPTCFGEGPWPCLNTTCMFYRKPSIKECQISYRRGPKQPRGIFSCECGFVYVRMGPDKSPDDKYRIGQIRSYGHVWEETLRRLCDDSTMSMKERAIHLGVNYSTVKTQISKLGLNYPNIQIKILQPKQTDHLDSQVKFLKKRDEYRTLFLSIIQDNPSISRTELNKLIGTVKIWLSKYDVDWFRAHNPPSKRYHHFTPTRNWNDLDIQLVQEVPLAAISIKERSGHPIRVTKSQICRVLNQPSLLYAYGKINLPLTTQIIAEFSETLEDFTIRKIQWVVDRYQEEKVIPSRSQLMNRASVYNKIHIPKINSAIDEALESFTRPLC